MDASHLAAAAPQGRAFIVEQEVRIAAPPEQVWRSLTADIGSWWSHSMSKEPWGIVLEARAGGQFKELFDAEGNGALFSTVTLCQPPRLLKLVGTLGMKHPVLNQSQFELSPEGAGTLVRVTMESFGLVEPEIEAGYRQGWSVLLGSLKGFVESGTKVR